MGVSTLEAIRLCSLTYSLLESEDVFGLSKPILASMSLYTLPWDLKIGCVSLIMSGTLL